LGSTPKCSSLHLTPQVFTHFWAWWGLFEGTLSLPIRQGTYYPRRVISPKLGRHLATLKYRIAVSRLFLTHVYIEDARDTWADGVTPFIGIKAMIENFHADMHQREQETVVSLPGLATGSKITRSKPFYAAEVVLKGLDLRAMTATFDEPIKKSVPITATGQPSNYRSRLKHHRAEQSTAWVDVDDFVELDWRPTVVPSVHLFPLVSCPRFTYFKRTPNASQDPTSRSKFGSEDSHVCLLGTEPCKRLYPFRLASLLPVKPAVLDIQISLLLERIEELKNTWSGLQANSAPELLSLTMDTVGSKFSPPALSADATNRMLHLIP
jgi:hypothetical protein